MLIQFSVANYRSIKDRATVSLASGAAGSDKELLTAAAFYGANASGKSNILRALVAMSRLVLNETKIMQSTDELPHDPFLLSTETNKASTSFDIVFTHAGKKYKYGFDYDRTTVYAEYLYVYDSAWPTKVFALDRDEDEPDINTRKFPELKKADLLPNMLFLWECDRKQNGAAQAVMRWFRNLVFLGGVTYNDLFDISKRAMQDGAIRKKIAALMQKADFGIADVTSEKADARWTANAGNVPVYLKVQHSVYDESGKKIGSMPFSITEQESYGTYKFFAMSAPIILALEEGRTILIDEFDSNIHPVLTRKIIELFNDAAINTKGAQLNAAFVVVVKEGAGVVHGKRRLWRDAPYIPAGIRRGAGRQQP